MADGQVLIDSKLDSSGVERGTKEIEKEFERAAKSVSKSMEKIEDAVQEVDVSDTADGMSESFDSESQKIQQILSDTTMDARTKAAKIAAEFRESGMDSSTAFKKAWATVRSESASGSRKVIADIDDIGDKAESAGGKISGGLGNAFKSLAASATVYFGVEEIIEAGMAAIQASADIRAENAQFAQTFKDLENVASASLNAIAKNTGITASRMQKSYTSVYAFSKSVGVEEAQALDISNRAMLAAADSAAYYDRSLEDATETLQSFLKGNYENDAALGFAATETTRNAAANRLYAKSFDKLTEAQKVDVLLSMVEAANEASGALGQAARESESWTNVTGELKEAWRQLLAVVGEPILDYVTPILKDVTVYLNEFREEYKDFDFKELFGDTNLAPLVKSIKEFSKSSSDLSKVIGSGLKYAYENVLVPLGTWTIEAGLPALLDSLGASFEFLGSTLEYLSPLGESLLNDFLIPLGNWTGGAIVDILGVLEEGFQNLATAADESTLTAAERINQNFQTAAQYTEQGFVVPTHDQMLALYEDIGTWFSGAADGIVSNFDTAARTLDTGFVVPTREEMQALGELISEAFTNAADSLKEAWNSIGQWFDANVVQPIEQGITDLLNSALNAWSNIKAETEATWEHIKNTVSNAIKKIQEWINGLTGKDINIGVSQGGTASSASVSPTAAYTPASYTYTPQIPYLATGAVIPPNAPFLAMLGDQRSGTNIEAPLETIKQALAEVMMDGIGDTEVNIYFNGTLAQLGRLLNPVIEVEKKRKGTSLVEEVMAE